MKSHFHDYRHALDFDQRAARSDIRAQLSLKLIEALELGSGQRVLDLATGTGRFARPLAEHLRGGKVIGLDQALAMIRVGQEQNKKEPIPAYLQLAGDVESMPFRPGVFGSAFVAFSLHHFAHPSLMVREAHRILCPGGQLVILDPVLHEPRDSLDQSLHGLINQVFRRSHGEDFRFLTAAEIRELLSREDFEITRADLHTFRFDQDDMEGIPTGRHWLEVVEELEQRSSNFRQRFEEKYFRSEKRGEKTHVEGSFSYVLVCGKKP